MRVRRWIRYVIAGVGILVTLVILVVLSTFTPIGRRVLLDFALARAQNVLAADLSIGRLGGTLFTGSRLEQVALHVDGEPVITASAIEVDYSLRDLLARRFRISRIELFEPQIVLARTHEGWNVSRIVRRKPDGKPVSFKLENVLIRNGTVTLVNGPRDVGGVRVPTTYSDVNMSLLVERRPSETELDIQSLSLHGSNPTLTVKRLSGRIITRERGLVFDAVHLDTAQSALMLDGHVDYPENGEDP
jgi:hypothetical protein